jgi:two-component system, OmpR family, response regulator
MRSLAIIEDDPAAWADLRSTLESGGFAADRFADGRTAIVCLRKRPFSLAIIDLAIRDTDPFAICREASSMLPVIAIAERFDEETCIRALEAGADDCVPRPIAGRELLARINNLLRRSTRLSADGPFGLSLSEMRVRTGDVTQELTRGETEVLSLLLDHAPSPLTIGRMSELLDAKRGTVESRIKSLRRKLGEEILISRGRLGYQIGSP